MFDLLLLICWKVSKLKLSDLGLDLRSTLKVINLAGILEWAMCIDLFSLLTVKDLRIVFAGMSNNGRIENYLAMSI